MSLGLYSLDEAFGKKFQAKSDEVYQNTGLQAERANIKTYKQYLSKLIKNKETELILEHKADYKYPVVSAASILAKVTRDNEIKKIKNKINHDFGSGYMSDPKTVKFLDAYFEKNKNIFRKSWIPYKERLNNKFQSKLVDFSKFVKNS